MAQRMGSEETQAWVTAQLESLNGSVWNVAGLGRALYILAAVVFFSVVFFEQYSKRKERLAKLPPGPFQWPFLGNLPHLVRSAGIRSASTLRETVAALASKYGPIMMLQIVDRHFVVVSSGEFAKEVLVTHDAEFYFRPRCAMGKYLGFGNSSITFAEGRHHWYLRKLCDTRLFSPDCFSSYARLQRAEAGKMLHSVWEAAQRGEDISIRDTVTSFVRNSMCGMLLGSAHLDVENTSIQFTRETLTTLLEDSLALVGETTLSDLTPGLSWLDWRGREGQLKDLHVNLKKYFQVILDDRSLRLENEEPPEALVDVLLSLDEDYKLSSDAIMGILLDALVGGIYPVVATVEWALSELVRHPAMLEKVQMEINDVVGPYHIIEEAEFPQLTFFQAIVKETLRLHPSVPLSLPHTNKVAAPLGCYAIPAQTTVVVDFAAVGRDPAVWPHPLRFDPRRFAATDAASQIDTFKLLPFGYGRRGCPGANLGVVLAQLGLATLVQGFDWQPRRGQLPHDIDVREDVAGPVGFRATPLTLRATPRLADSLYEL